MLAFTKTSAFSVSFWMNSGSGALQVIVGKGTGFNQHNSPGWTVFTAYGYLYFQLHATSTVGVCELQSQDYHSGVAVCTSSWNYVVVTYNGNEDATGVTFYINGTKVATQTDFDDLGMATASEDITNNVDASIGATPPGTANRGFYSGDLEELNVFNCVLSPGQVTATLASYHAGEYGTAAVVNAGISGDLLLAGYHLDLAPNGIVADYTGNGNNGVLCGTPLPRGPRASLRCPPTPGRPRRARAVPVSSATPTPAIRS